MARRSSSSFAGERSLKATRDPRRHAWPPYAHARVMRSQGSWAPRGFWFFGHCVDLCWGRDSGRAVNGVPGDRPLAQLGAPGACRRRPRRIRGLSTVKRIVTYWAPGSTGSTPAAAAACRVGQCSCTGILRGALLRQIAVLLHLTSAAYPFGHTELCGAIRALFR